MANIFDINFTIQVTNLTPPSKRLPKILNFLISLTYPLQWLRDLILGEYKTGSAYSNWDHLVGYTQYTRVVYTDKAVYECINPLGAAGNSQSPANALYWLKVNENFIGTDERVKYSSQIIMFEYALNRWFRNPQPNPQIYISNTPTSYQFMMGQTSAYSDKMANAGFNQSTFMGNVYTPLQFDYTIFFPTALFAALPPTLTSDKEKVVRNFADKYNLVGMKYQVITY